jgi:isopentenyl-diphosphate delta-isomerase
MSTEADLSTSNRKTEHIRICLEEDVQARGITVGLEQYRFIHEALPELDLAEIDLHQSFFGKTVSAPILISSMTGGAEWSARINRNLAEAAQQHKLAMGLGSQRAAIENPDLAYSYQIRRYAPDIPLFANLGAVQLNYGYGIDQCRRAVEMIEADALILHLNVLQEAVQPDGNTNFKGLLGKIEKVCRELARDGVPVIAKEVGNGFSKKVSRRLYEAGVSALDVGGSGGTSWSQVESFRIKQPLERSAAETFAGWGVPTAQSVLWAREVAPDLTLIGSGGLRTGLDIAKIIALGVDAGGLALPFLKAAEISAEAVSATIEQLTRELKIAMFCIGAATIKELQYHENLVRV